MCIYRLIITLTKNEHAFFFFQGNFKFVERFAFYERAKKAFAVVATGWAFLFMIYDDLFSYFYLRKIIDDS